MNQIEEAMELQALTQHPGWRHFIAILDEMAREPKDELWEIMARKPDTLTGKTALKFAIRSKALTDLKDEVESRLKVLIPTRQKGGS